MRRFFYTGLLGVLLLPSAAFAQGYYHSGAQAREAEERAAHPPLQGWNVTVGVASNYGPVYQGSDDYGFSVFPDLRLRYGDDFFASIPEGMGYNVINGGGFKTGPILKVRFGRDSGDGGSPFLVSGESQDLRGMGDIGTAGEAGVFAQYSVNRYVFRGEWRQGFGGHTGWMADLNADYTGYAGPVRWRVGPRVSYAGSDYINTYFGIEGERQTYTGLPYYHSDAGLSSYGINGSAVIPVSESVAITTFAGYSRLGDNIADSPLVDQRGSADQFSVGVGIGYQFTMDDVTLPNFSY